MPIAGDDMHSGGAIFQALQAEAECCIVVPVGPARQPGRIERSQVANVALINRDIHARGDLQGSRIDQILDNPLALVIECVKGLHDGVVDLRLARLGQRVQSQKRLAEGRN